MGGGVGDSIELELGSGSRVGSTFGLLEIKPNETKIKIRMIISRDGAEKFCL